ncbi:hypothetical protein A4C53_RS16520 [Elizabethkingia anophelis]|uniref:hypothetical protein n=1 Tax=Elizabethkingia anophelis TaxID=1117645 RepID=UPI00077E9DB3|nr:hypothetical protein [Elizabethkingia anophelis]AMR42391.1 hypothetical protein A2T74_13995 [Elizabethkingia anophelis]AMX49030.1 hypothetical protein A4C56_13995 [Elizabethkingia anophelis]AMX52489.1 hypothetical protein A2T72_13995 [Elizabethkingia anophelis]AMX55879.1 hypothetical protein A2T59_13995 [Elizabethkingia anophelis]EGT4348694.1 hypothetical protein [Elizabethkingia anophelis]
MKKKLESLKAFWDTITLILKEEYKAPKNHISLKLITFIPFAPVIGFTYLVFYFNSFNGFSYDELDFSINDCIAIMYSKGLILFLTIILTFVCLMPILSGIIDFITQKEQQTTTTNGIVLTTALACLLTIVIMLDILKVIPSQQIFSLVILLIIALVVYLFKDKNQGAVLGIVFSGFFCILLAKSDARKIKQSKPKFQITLSDQNGKPVDILSKQDRCKYYIKKTTNMLYIMDECKKTLNTYRTSDVISMGIASNNNE